MMASISTTDHRRERSGIIIQLAIKMATLHRQRRPRVWSYYLPHSSTVTHLMIPRKLFAAFQSANLNGCRQRMSTKFSSSPTARTIIAQCIIGSSTKNFYLAYGSDIWRMEQFNGGGSVLKNNGSQLVLNYGGYDSRACFVYCVGGKWQVGMISPVRERPSSMEDLRRLLEFYVRKEDGGAGRDHVGGDGNNLQLPIIITTRLNMSWGHAVVGLRYWISNGNTTTMQGTRKCWFTAVPDIDAVFVWERL